MAQVAKCSDTDRLHPKKWLTESYRVIISFLKIKKLKPNMFYIIPFPQTLYFSVVPFLFGSLCGVKNACVESGFDSS